MSVLTDGPKIDLAETLKTWLVLAKTIVIMSAAIVMRQAIQNHPLKLGRSLKAVMSDVLVLFDMDFMGQWYWM